MDPEFSWTMESIFRQLERAGKSDAEHLMLWMKAAYIINPTENDTGKIFKDVANQQEVRLDQFKDVITAIAVKEQTPVDILDHQLATEGPIFVDGVIAGLGRMKKVFGKTGHAGPAAKF